MYNLFWGPFPVSQEEIVNYDINSFINKSFVSFIGENPIDTGYEAITQTVDKNSNKVTKEESTANYVVFPQPESILIVKSTKNHSGNSYRGFLKPVPSDIRNQIVSDIEKEVPEAKGKFLALMLDETDQPNVFLPVLLLILFAYAFWDLSKIIKDLSRFGDEQLLKEIEIYGDSQKLITEIDSEIDKIHNNIDHTKLWHETNTGTNNNLILTKSWLIYCKTFETHVIRLESIVWAYEKVVSHSVNFIPTGKTYALSLKTSKFQSFEVPSNETDIKKLLNELVNRFPWIIFGHKPEIETLWNSHKQEFIKVVEGKKAEAAK
jgi:hypothetical protein